MGSERLATKSSCLAAVVVAMAGLLVGERRAEAQSFVLHNSDVITVSSHYSDGALYDQSHATIRPLVSVSALFLYNSSSSDVAGYIGAAHVGDTSSLTVLAGGTLSDTSITGNGTLTVSRGAEIYGLDMYDYAVAHIAGAWRANIGATGFSQLDISGGTFDLVGAHNFSRIEISGGSAFNGLFAYDSSTITLIGRHFQAGSGLTIDGTRLLGTGQLSGEWLDGSTWTTRIYSNASSATIEVVPEPATLSLLGLGLSALLARRKRK